MKKNILGVRRKSSILIRLELMLKQRTFTNSRL